MYAQISALFLKMQAQKTQEMEILSRFYLDISM